MSRSVLEDRATGRWSDAEAIRAIFETKHCVDDRRYNAALRLIERMAEDSPADEWIQSLAAEARQLLVDAEGRVSNAEHLAAGGRWDEALAALQGAIEAYDHRPGLWFLMISMLPGWSMTLLMGGAQEDHPQLQRIKELQALATKRNREREPRVTWVDRIATLEDPWPMVVQAFCASRPAASVIFDPAPPTVAKGLRADDRRCHQ